MDALIHEHRHDSIIIGNWGGVDREALLANTWYSFPSPNLKVTIQEDAQQLPLRELWEDWVEKRPAELLDDGFELVRARLMLERHTNEQSWPAFWATFQADDQTQPKLKYRQIVDTILRWLVRLYPTPNTTDFLLDCVETIWGSIPEDDLQGIHDRENRRTARLTEQSCISVTRIYRLDIDAVWEDWHHVRLWNLVHWMDEPVENVIRFRPYFEEVLRACFRYEIYRNVELILVCQYTLRSPNEVYNQGHHLFTLRKITIKKHALIAHKLGAATVDDIYDQLLGSRTNAFGNGFGEIQQLSHKKPSELFQEYPILVEIFESRRQHVLNVELSRGDMPTEPSRAASSLGSIPGISWFIRILQALGKQDISRERGGQNRSAALSHLLYVSYPTRDETLADFSKAVKKSGILVERFIEAAVYAPQ